MSKHEERYDRLANRLGVIISRLFLGESLPLKALAQEFNISERTLRRDLKERLQYLDIEFHDGSCRLCASQRPYRTDKDIINFANITHVAQFFPALDRKLLSVLLDEDPGSPYIVYNAPPKKTPSLFGGFYVITQAIVRNKRIHFLYETVQYTAVEPYRLIYYEGEWYLSALVREEIQVFSLIHIRDVILTISHFNKKEKIKDIISDRQFITALPHFQYVKGLFIK